VTSKQRSETPPADKPTFEQALERLESIVKELEDGQTGLTEGLTHYEEGVKLLRQCYQLLDSAQRRIELLNRVDPDGKEECEPFDDSATSLEEKAQKRGSRRSRPPSAKSEQAEDEMDGPARLF
jgi:exodeoxyribonuclease VII small subunit